MAFVLWIGIGVVVSLLVGAVRRAPTQGRGVPWLAGAFGGVVGGVIGDGVPRVMAGELTLGSLLGAAVGALIFALAVRTAPTGAAP